MTDASTVSSLRIKQKMSAALATLLVMGAPAMAAPSRYEADGQCQSWKSKGERIETYVDTVVETKETPPFWSRVENIYNNFRNENPNWPIPPWSTQVREKRVVHTFFPWKSEILFRWEEYYKEHMNWDDTIKVTKEVTRQRGVNDRRCKHDTETRQYIGFENDSIKKRFYY